MSQAAQRKIQEDRKERTAAAGPDWGSARGGDRSSDRGAPVRAAAPAAEEPKRKPKSNPFGDAKPVAVLDREVKVTNSLVSPICRWGFF